jgi:hypothetical protein
MKKTQLQKIIREAINEVLNETTVSTTVSYKGNKPDKILKVDPSDTETIANIKSDPTVDHASMGDKKLKEMANIGKLFQLAPDADISTLTGQKLRIATAMQADGGPISQADVAKALGYTKTIIKKGGGTIIVGKQNPIDANFRALGAEGIIIPAGTQIAQRFSRPAPELGNDGERPETIDGPESFLIGGGDPLAGMFDGEHNDDGSEDFNDDTEPTLDDLEPDDELPPAPSTDKEKAADFTTDDSNSRLIQSIINNYTTLKSRAKGGGEMGGLAGSDMMTAIRSSKAAAELRFPQKMQQLIDKIKEQEPAVQKAILDSLITKFASVKLPSLAKAIAKELNVDAKIPTLKIPIEEPEEEIEDTLDEAFDAEYTKRKLQFYAGIIK